jgi:transposase-like protein
MKHRTRKERVFNEATGWYETREVELKSYSFTDDDRLLIIREYLESGLPAEKIIKKYHISSRSVLFSWMDKFLNERDSLPLQQEPEIEEDMAKTKDERLKEKDAEIKRLRKALEMEKLRSHAYSTMIDLAPNSKSAPQGMPRCRTGHSLRAVWLQQTSLQQTCGQGRLRRGCDRAYHHGEGARIPKVQPRPGCRETARHPQEAVR